MRCGASRTYCSWNTSRRLACRPSRFAFLVPGRRRGFPRLRNALGPPDAVRIDLAFLRRYLQGNGVATEKRTADAVGQGRGIGFSGFHNLVLLFMVVGGPRSATGPPIHRPPAVSPDNILF